MGRLMGNVANSYITTNPPTILRMFGGTFRLLSEMSVEGWLKGVAGVWTTPPSDNREMADRIHDVSGYFHERHRRSQAGRFTGLLDSPSTRKRIGTSWKAFSNALAKANETEGARKVLEIGETIMRGGLEAIRIMQAIDHLVRWVDTKIMVGAVRGFMADGASFEEAVRLAENAFRRTQNTSDAADDSLFAARVKHNNHQIMKSLLMFSSDPMKAHNQMRRAWRERNMDGGRERAARTAAAVTLNSLWSVAVNPLFAALGTGVSAAVGWLDDEDEEWSDFDQQVVNAATQDKEVARAAERLSSEFVSNSFGVIGWFASEVTFSAAQLIEGRRPSTDVVEVPVLGEINNLVRSMFNAKYGDATMSAFTLAGIPIAGPVRTARKLFDADATLTRGDPSGLFDDRDYLVWTTLRAKQKEDPRAMTIEERRRLVALDRKRKVKRREQQ
tara:strand:- start:75 stop:1406 length:1332 start_codon:yes stop_codon:yes gene_type:complete